MNNLANLNLNNFVILSAILFSIGVSGMFLNRKNIISLLMSIEMMLLAVNINFVAFSAFLHDLVGQIFAIFVLTVAGAEAAIGLAILVIYFQNRNTIEIKSISSMKG
jgi:NADH-quinone oxidoreductase subunit K